MGINNHNSGCGGRRQRGFSLIELLIVVAIILIICAIAIPNILHARMAANQAAAAANIRSITTAALAYQSLYQNGYPPSLAVLGGTDPATCNGAELVDDIVATPPYQKSGYTYTYAGQDGNLTTPAAGCGAAGFNGYFIGATPVQVSVSGQESFCSYTPGVIHFDNSGAPVPDETTCSTLPTLQ